MDEPINTHRLTDQEKQNMADSMSTTYPDLVFEILRYPATTTLPETWRFFSLEPSEINFGKSNYRPFQDRTFRGIQKGQQNYCETERHQIPANMAYQMRWWLVEEGYRAVEFEDLPLNLAHFATHSQCPIEFHSGLDGRDPEVMKLVTVWVRGQLPAEVSA